MAVYVPSTGGQRVIFEQLAQRVVDQYAEAERRILAQLQRRLDRLLTAEGPTQRLQEQLVAVRQLEAEARAALAGIDDRVVHEVLLAAEAAGAGAALDRLGLANHLPQRGPITTGRARALGLLQADVDNRLDDVKRRILRFEQDAYQRLAADTVPQVLLGTQGRLDAQRAGVARWLDRGITAFRDAAGREWTTGAYVEMTTRTALFRAYTESALIRMESAGVNLVTIVVGVGACKPCAQWIGKVLSTDGTTGDVVIPHAATGQDITVHVDGTLDGARAAGWGHPNCRCHVAAYLPGLPIPAAATTYDPEQEAALARQRELERRIRRLKLRETLNPDGDATDTRARIRATERQLREHIREHDLPRKRNREQPAFQTG